MKKTSKKLLLNKETIIDLNQLKYIKGGFDENTGDSRTDGCEPIKGGRDSKLC